MAMRTKGWLLATAGAAALLIGSAQSSEAGFIFKFDNVDQGEPYSVGDSVDGGQETGDRKGFDLEDGATGNILTGTDLESIDPLIEVTGIKDDEELVAGTLSLFTNATDIIVNTGTAGSFAFSGMTDDNGLFTASFDVTGENEGRGNAVSNIEVVPLPAAAWMMIGGLGLIGGAVKWRRRGVTADA